jgi:dihydroxyacid dehydratase/phosphogluconate dehydratase
VVLYGGSTNAALHLLAIDDFHTVSERTPLIVSLKPGPLLKDGVMAKYIRLVSSAAEGAVTSRIF